METTPIFKPVMKPRRLVPRGCRCEFRKLEFMTHEPSCPARGPLAREQVNEILNLQLLAQWPSLSPWVN